MEILHWKTQDIPELQTHLKSKFHYSTPNAQNEIIEICGNSIRAALVQKVQANRVLSLIADETSDISHLEQLSLCFRTVTCELDVEEHFFKYVAVSNT